jgi:DNA-binding FrmR family transcriptional regulator
MRSNSIDRVSVNPILIGGISLDVYTPIGYLSSMSQTAKSSRLKSLNRIEGQVRGLARMVEEDRYCIDIITQIAAARAALARVEEQLLREHVQHCVRHAMTSGNKAEQERKIEELIAVVSRTKT